MFLVKRLLKPILVQGTRFQLRSFNYFKPVYFSHFSNQKIELNNEESKSGDARRDFVTFVQTGLIKFSEGDLDSSFKAFQEALRIHNETWAPTVDVIEILVYQYMIYGRKGQIQEALSTLETAESIIPSIQENQHELLTKVKQLQGEILLKLGRVDEALKALHDGLINLEKSTAKDIRYRAVLYMRFIEAYKVKGNFKEALVWGKKFLAEINSPQVDPTRTMEVYQMLGTIYFKLRDFEKAQESYQKGLELAGEKLPISALLIQGLGSVAQAQGKFNEAQTHLEKALKLAQIHFSPKSIGLAVIYNELGILKKHLGKLTQAIDYHKKALEIVEGKGTVEEANTLNNLASLLLDQRKHQEARGYLERSLEINQKINPEVNLELSSIYMNLGSVCRYENDFQNAIKYYKMSMENTEKIFGEDHPEGFIATKNLGITYQFALDLTNAKEYLLKSARIADKHNINDIYQLIDLYGCLTRLHFDLKDYDEALKYCTKAQECAKSYGDPNWIKNFELFQKMIEDQKAGKS